MTKKLPSDQAVRDRVIHDLGASFAVEAGAGTGKTALLTARMVEAVATGRARLEEIVAITFTDRAANELKVRLRSELEKGLTAAGGDAAARFADALAALDSAHTSTIHSFAAALLRERPVEAAVDPGFEIADELQASLLFDRAWERWIAAQLADESSTLRSAFIAGLSVEHLRQFGRFMLANPGLHPAGGKPAPAPEDSEAVAAFVTQARAVSRSIRARCTSPGSPCQSKAAEAARAADEIAAAPPADLPARLAGIPPIGVKKAQHACSGCGAKDVCKSELNELEERAEPLRGPAAQAVVCSVYDALLGAVAEYANAKHDAALLDFDDLLIKARDLLRDRKDVRRYFQQRFKLILVDECQDTDPLQTEIAFFLAEDGARADAWRDVRAEPGRLLFVGDPKQSIYRFRRADIETYEEAKQVIARTGELVTISQNFRSARNCVAWVNAVFSKLIERPKNGAYQPDYVPLDPWREDDGPAVTVLGPPDGKPFDKIGEARAAEAAAVAAEIRAIIERGDIVLDRETKQPRPATFRDVAILFRTRLAFDVYEDALAAFGVPYRAISGKGFYARQEVSEFRVVLAAVERAYDPLAVVAALRTALLGISDDELAAGAPTRFDYLAQAAPDIPPALRDVFTLLARWHRDRNAVTSSRLVQTVLSDTKALELFYLKPGGEQRAANLTKVIDAARAFEQMPDATFGGFVRWLDEMSLAAAEEESPLASEEDGDFVKLITIHKAKGLEFPVVVLADLSAGRKGSADAVVNRRDGTFDVRLGPKDLGLATAGFDAATDYEALRADAESRRLLYVAATRARDRLIVSHFRSKRNESGSHLAYLTDQAAGAGKPYESAASVPPAQIKPIEPGAFRVKLSGEPPDDCEKLCEERTAWRRDRDELIARAAVSRRLATASGLAEAAAGGPEERHERHGSAAVGIAVHAVLEQADLATGAGIEQLAGQEATSNGIPDKRVEIERLARAALASDLVQRAAKAPRCYREVPFAIKVRDTVLEGTVDLAFEDPAGLHIVDYKTDAVAAADAPAHAEHYRPQVAAYALAVREVFGRLPQSATLLFLRPNCAVPISIDDALLDAVTSSL